MDRINREATVGFRYIDPKIAMFLVNSIITNFADYFENRKTIYERQMKDRCKKDIKTTNKRKLFYDYENWFKGRNGVIDGSGGIVLYFKKEPHPNQYSDREKIVVGIVFLNDRFFELYIEDDDTHEMFKKPRFTIMIDYLSGEMEVHQYYETDIIKHFIPDVYTALSDPDDWEYLIHPNDNYRCNHKGSVLYKRGEQILWSTPGMMSNFEYIHKKENPLKENPYKDNALEGNKYAWELLSKTPMLQPTIEKIESTKQNSKEGDILQISLPVVNEVTVSIRQVMIGRRQMTLRVFRQIYWKRVFGPGINELVGEPWGYINYDKDNLDNHRLILWITKNGDLRKYNLPYKYMNGIYMPNWNTHDFPDWNHSHVRAFNYVMSLPQLYLAV